MNQKAFRQVLIILLFIALLVNVVTGVIKYPELQRYFIFTYNYISASTLSWWHDVSGLVLAGLIIIHLIINRKKLFPWLTEYFARLRRPRNGKTILSVVIVALIAVTVAGFYYLSYRTRPIQLNGVEVKDYQGEKLGSVNDFRENSIKGPQHVDINNYRLQITGLVSAPATFTYDEVIKLPTYQKVVTINCVEGWSVKVLWDGPLVKDLFKNITIKPEANTVIFHAVDGYSTSFPLDYILTNNIMMASKMNGVVLPPERGFPFQLIAEQKWGYKWIKWITKIELSNDSNYKGYWESRGYNNNGDLNGPKFGL